MCVYIYIYVYDITCYTTLCVYIYIYMYYARIALKHSILYYLMKYYDIIHYAQVFSPQSHKKRSVDACGPSSMLRTRRLPNGVGRTGLQQNVHKYAIRYVNMYCFVWRCYLHSLQSSPSCERAHVIAITCHHDMSWTCLGPLWGV